MTMLFAAEASASSTSSDSCSLVFLPVHLEECPECGVWMERSKLDAGLEGDGWITLDWTDGRVAGWIVVRSTLLWT